MSRLTDLQAFNAMRLYLEKYYQETASDDVGSVLGDLFFLPGGGTADPAAWYSWIKSIEKVQQQENLQNNKLTIVQSFNAMKFFLEKFYDESHWDDIGLIVRKLQPLVKDYSIHPIVLQDWMICVQKAIELGEHKELIILKKI